MANHIERLITVAITVIIGVFLFTNWNNPQQILNGYVILYDIDKMITIDDRTIKVSINSYNSTDLLNIINNTNYKYKDKISKIINSNEYVTDVSRYIDNCRRIYFFDKYLNCHIEVMVISNNNDEKHSTMHSIGIKIDIPDEYLTFDLF